MSDPTPGAAPDSAPTPTPRRDDAVPGGPWKSWGSIYTTLAIWGVVCILFLAWITATLNVEVDDSGMDTAAGTEVVR